MAFAAPLALAQGPQHSPEDDLTPEAVALEQHYHQPLRPQFHYTPIQGDLNDATGLIYYRGEYHLFHMYDEWSLVRAAHKRWGHAISTDLVHWQQVPPILDTLIDNAPGSGSGVVDWNNSSGLRAGAEKALLIFYTDYKRGTCVAVSQDRGRTWVRYAKNPIIASTRDARDPLVFWYEAANEWRMVRYEQRGFAFYKSTDLLQWTWMSRVEGYFECPDFFELPVVNAPGERRWILVDGNGTYVVGSFDGQQFTPQSDKLKVEYGKALYATQTWKSVNEHGPLYQIAWMRHDPLNRSLTWSGQMCFPVELSLRSYSDGIRLCRQPVDKIASLYAAIQSWRDVTIESGGTAQPTMKADLLDLRMEWEVGTATDFGLTIRGIAVRYSVAAKELSGGREAAPLTLAGNRLRLRVLVDRSSIEVFADDGQVTLSLVQLQEAADQDIRFTAEGGKARLVSLVAARLESIWPGVV